MSYANDLAARIIGAGLATAVGKDIFLGSAAAIPSMKTGDMAVGPFTSIIDTGGAGALREHDGKYPRPELQVVVRASSAVVAKAKAEALHEALGDLFNVTIGTRFYLSIGAVQEVLDMQKDEAGRPRFGFNVQMVCRQ